MRNECDHEVCNRVDASDMTEAEIEQTLVCMVARGLAEFVRFDSGEIGYRLTAEGKARVEAMGIKRKAHGGEE